MASRRTPEGAAAQLAAIEVRVLSAMSLPLATEVYRDWGMPGGVGAADWSQTRNVQSFLAHARQSSNVLDPVSAYYLICRLGYDLACWFRWG